MQNQYLSKDQIQAIIDEAPKNVPADEIITGLVNRGFTLEGLNDKSTENPNGNEKGFFGRVGDALGNRAEQIGQGIDKFGDYNEAVREGASSKEQGKNLVSGAAKIASGVAGGIGDVVGEVVKSADELVTGGAITDAIGGAVNEFMQSKGGKMAIKTYNELAPEGSVTRDVAEAIGNVATVIPTVKGASVAINSGFKIGKGGYNMAKDTVGVISGARKIGKNVLDTAPAGSSIRNLADDFFKPSVADESTLTTLNPFLFDKTKVSIPLGDNKYAVKEIGKDAITAEERALVKADILTKYDNYLNKSKEFMKDPERTAGYTAIDIVGQNIDKYVEVVNKLRRDTGAKMGAIENKATDLTVDLSNTKNFNSFMQDVQNKVNNVGFGGTEKVPKETLQFYKDLGKLQKNGASVKNVLEFTRTWATKLEDMKDNFGGFTKNKYSNTQIQNVLNDIKNQARNTLSEVDDSYKGLVSNYRETSVMREQAQRLLGQDGVYGDSLRGASTAKRAVKSVSDAGSRQFLLKLKELTGYDGLSDAKIALQAMEDAGDFKGLSLLELLKDGKKGFMSNAFEYATEKVRGDNTTRVKDFINKEQ